MPELTLPILYSQWDNRWANILLGNNTDPRFNIYNYGCLITALAMASNYFGKSINPAEINEKLKSVNGFISGGLYVYGSLNKIYGDIKEKRTDTPLPLTDEQLGAIRSAIDSNYPVLLEIDVNPRTVANDQHFVLAIGYNPADENDIKIADPLGGKVRSLKDYLGIYRPSVRKAIESFTVLEGPKPKPSNLVCLSKDDAERRTHNSEEWIKLHGYLSLGGDPSLTSFEDAQRVIAGFKSRATDLETQVEKKNTEISVLNQTVENKNKEISTLKDELLEQEKSYKARIKAINDAMPDVEKITREYEGTITSIKGELTVARQERDEALLKLAECQNNNTDSNVRKGLVKLIDDLLQWIITRANK